MSINGGNGRTIPCVDCPLPNDFDRLGDRVSETESRMAAIGRIEGRIDGMADCVVGIRKDLRAIYELMAAWAPQSQRRKRS